ncbi:hypothetical protein KZZ52_49945 [Dactylosporangium sp. AC04546]|uniref:hypothetical protein n=1 Tax=Dactylosporangium sp. AC04546 TaxID=2862460 RepID=UPI001EDD0218|nr:hypothetical protein [Dactylosporangium sp. AC04546]WVK82008.1 hypothetical protein KZZ52_49945 [Dactylosporangium sp. AC04546]
MTDDAEGVPPTDLADALRALEGACQSVESKIRAMAADDRLAEAEASSLVERLRVLYESATDLRNAMVYRIWQAEEMSLSVLAQRVGVSKARADQIIRREKSKEGQGG